MAGSQPRTVFISCTSELVKHPTPKRSYVAAAVEGARRAGFLAKHMADFTAEDAPAAEVDDRNVRECDVYIGLFGFRWGSASLLR